MLAKAGIQLVPIRDARDAYFFTDSKADMTDIGMVQSKAKQC